MAGAVPTPGGEACWDTVSHAAGFASQSTGAAAEGDDVSRKVTVVTDAHNADGNRRLLGLTPLRRLQVELEKAGLGPAEILEVGGAGESLESVAARLQGPAVVVDGAAVFRKGLLGDLLAEGGDGRITYRANGRAVLIRVAPGSPGEPGRDVSLDGKAIAIAGPADVKPARWVLLNGLRKPMLIDGVVGYYFMRPITLRITALLAETPVTPNMVTGLCFLLGMAGAGLVAAAASQWVMALGVLLYFVGATLDCVDGEMARVKYLASRWGAWFDTLSDDISTAALLAALGLYVSRTTGDAWPLVLGLSASGGFLLGELYVYYYLLTWFKSGDVLDFVWAFQEGKPKGAPTAAAYFLLLAKRDFFSAFLAVCAFAGWIRFGAAVVSASCVCYTLVVLYDVAVVVRRGGRRRAT